ncbi:adhesion G-protein coupled receptor G5-like [Clupea harengus]|uniref:Adhesion G-protein coupled receptor G5-like n=1 Tax=Clupea harengus TaxID=7950 RepID=A0A6P8EP23_CLUHA|nr:adhesion G-protein coupled receptor G5-like [Clupea harengus]
MYLKRKKLDHSSSIHLQLSLALLLLHVSFLLSAWGAAWQTTQDHRPITAVCQVLGAGLHWALLATFSWMAIEGLHLYLLLVRIFNIYVKRYLLKLALLGWGLPSVTMGVCAALRVYGPHRLEDDMNNSSTICWLSESSAGSEGWRSVCVSVLKYLTVHAYLGAVLLFNGVILLLIGRELLGAGPRAVQGRGRVCRDAVTLLGLSFVLGLPWGLALCSHGPLTHIATYLFTVLNGLQGVFLFMWVLALTCRRNQQAESSSNTQSTIKMGKLGAS